MNTIGIKIAEFRKRRQMTQEDFAGCIGVSAQAVSRWENSVTMPDIMLLPVLADTLGVTIDSLFTENASVQAVPCTLHTAPKFAYQSVIDILSAAFEWDENRDRQDFVPLADALKAEPHTMAGTIGETSSLALFATDKIAVAHVSDYETFVSDLENEDIAEVFTALSDKNVREVMKYITERGRTLTAHSASHMTGITVENAQTALDTLAKLGFGVWQEVDSGEEMPETIRIFKPARPHYINLIVRPMMRLAERIALKFDSWQCLCG